MRIAIQKSPMINGDALLITECGVENRITGDPQELNLPVPDESPMQLYLESYRMLFGPTGPQDLFRDGYMYAIVEVQGNELLIQEYNGLNPLRWIALN